MENAKPFYILAFGFTGGIFLNSFHKMGFSFFLLSLLISLAIFVYGKFLHSDALNKKTIFLASFFIFAFALGLLRYEIKDLPNRDTMLQENLEQKVIVEGVVSDEPDKRENGVRLTVSFQNIIDFGFLRSSLNEINAGVKMTLFWPRARLIERSLPS